MYSQPYNSYNTPYPTAQTNKIYVSGLEDVRLRPQATNSDVIYLHNDQPYLYQKIVNDKGQFEIKTFKIIPEEAKPETPIVDMSAYVLKTDLEELQTQIKNLENKLRSVSDNGTSSTI